MGIEILITIAAVLTIIVAGAAVWFGYQLYVAHLLLRSFHRLIKPEVERDSEGRPLRERL